MSRETREAAAAVLRQTAEGAATNGGLQPSFPADFDPNILSLRARRWLQIGTYALTGGTIHQFTERATDLAIARMQWSRFTWSLRSISVPGSMCFQAYVLMRIRIFYFSFVFAVEAVVQAQVLDTDPGGGDALEVAGGCGRCSIPIREGTTCSIK